MKTASESVLRAVARTMSEARAGNVEAVGIITVNPQGVPEVSFAGESELVCAINTGADMLKQFLLAQIMMGAAQKTSGLVRPAGSLDG